MGMLGKPALHTIAAQKLMEIEKVVRPSAWTDFPTEKDPFGKYKFTGIEIYFN